MGTSQEDIFFQNHLWNSIQSAKLIPTSRIAYRTVLKKICFFFVEKRHKDRNQKSLNVKISSMVKLVIQLRIEDWEERESIRRQQVDVVGAPYLCKRSCN